MKNAVEITKQFNKYGMDISVGGNISDNHPTFDGTVHDSNCARANDIQSLYEKNSAKIEDRENSYDLSFINSKLNLNINIFRYKFSDAFIEDLSKFSRIHQYEERKTFKESWNIWVEDNNEIVSSEIKRLNELGYDGDVIDKMYKSARYYFRKKCTEKKTPQLRRDYIGSSKKLRDAMDSHIFKNINNNDYKPSDGFDDFCKNNIKLISEEVKELCSSGINDPLEIKNKFKKTYKNRYFMIIK